MDLESKASIRNGAIVRSGANDTKANILFLRLSRDAALRPLQFSLSVVNEIALTQRIGNRIVRSLVFKRIPAELHSLIRYYARAIFGHEESELTCGQKFILFYSQVYSHDRGQKRGTN